MTCSPLSHTAGTCRRTPLSVCPAPPMDPLCLSSGSTAALSLQPATEFILHSHFLLLLTLHAVGPENINLTISPSLEHYDEGSKIRLTCSSESRPAAQFMWFLNGTMLTATEPELSLVNFQENQSGNYYCQALNDKTLRSIQSHRTNKTQISGASVTSETNLSIEGNSFKLSCDAGGSMISREWKKDGVKLTPDDHLSLQENNRVLTFNSLSRKDTGVYLCNVTNPVSQEEAEYKMVVYYGPENVQIKGPSDIDLKTTLTLTCSAESVPASYTWMLNSTKIHNSAVYTKDNTEPSDGGNYICEVKNFVTGRTSSALHGLSVTGLPGLSGTKMLLILLMHLIIEVTHRVSRLIILSAVGFLKVFPTVHTCW
uniref:Ig-like domain-containing protein n=1 Tax=Gasterosteus aculeatus aculeatus TaxID=481459 RepID=A0AAQ4R590_GASAC